MKMDKIEELREQAQVAMAEMQRLQQLCNDADDDMIPSLAYKIKGYQLEYTALARRIKDEVFESKVPVAIVYDDGKRFCKIINFFRGGIKNGNE